ncbi:Collagen alpha-1(XVIII) chain [Liparis tanakae]|uniref:Collagen alpha-1(XVIII) chain n=1 Tax=Liparis tanakae TaxID=230148 RepID=A0A4Z2E837_9TELE|nr:Collagen alpha-1(XVIII) chain [Liparis tanakae]
MLRTALLLLLCAAGSLDAWLWFAAPEQGTTRATPALTTAPGVPSNGTLTRKEEEEEEEDDNLSGVGEEIVNEATGIRKFVEAWDATPPPTPPPTAWTASGGPAETVQSAANTTGNATGSREERGGAGLGGEAGPGSDPGSAVDGGTGLLGPSDSRLGGSDPSCLPLPSDWPVCSGERDSFFSAPNFLNHTSVEEVGAVLREWAWLPRARCHHAAERFLCLLLAPRCTPPPGAATPPLPPCRRFCHVLQDSCWASLEDGRLPVECQLLPERACAALSKLKGNRGRRVSGYT